MIDGFLSVGLWCLCDVVYGGLLCPTMTTVMQFGFAALEVGSIRPKNTKAVLMKNVLDAAIG